MPDPVYGRGCCQTWKRRRPLPIHYKKELDKEIAHETAERMRRAIAINMVIAWRIMLMTLMGREDSELPPDVLFSDIELKLLHAFAKKNATRRL